jgi:hypothetical protein
MVGWFVNSTLRHYGLRLWMTALLGAIAGMMLLPGWQQVWGVHWLVVPASMMMVLIFLGLGWAMNRIGSHFLAKQVKEAAVWERAGLTSEAKAAFEQIAGLYDSFWLSPRKRKQNNRWIGTRVTRFYLSRSRFSINARRVAATHVQHFPDDVEVVESWLDRMLSLEALTTEEYDAASAVGASLDDDRIQWRLFQLYLRDGQTDFEALKTYQRVWQSKTPLPETVLGKLAGLLLDAAVLSDWCLQVYLQAYESGELRCLEAMAAAVRWLPENEDNAASLATARELTADLTSERLVSLGRRFEPYEERRVLDHPSTKVPKIRLSAIMSFAGVCLRGLTLVFRRMADGLKDLGIRFGRLSKAYLFTAAVLVLLAMVLLFWHPWRNELKTAKTLSSPPPVQELAPITTDSFTIQVAAYLKPDDAKAYVQKLKQKGLDAFWTQAASANRTWYQVKVSHFPTRSQAQQYGDQLRTKGLIDDFYVAKYQPEK